MNLFEAGTWLDSQIFNKKGKSTDIYMRVGSFVSIFMAIRELDRDGTIRKIMNAIREDIGEYTAESFKAESNGEDVLYETEKALRTLRFLERLLLELERTSDRIGRLEEEFP